MNNPYTTLGVKPDADDKAIKTAWRSLQQKNHPDKAGDIDEFKEVQLAYDLLSDPERRARFDATGATTVEASKREQAEGVVASLAMQVINDTAIPESVLLRVQREVEAALANDRRAQEQAVKARNKLKKLLSKFKRKCGPNFIEGALVARIAEITGFLDKNTANQELLLEVLAVVEEYSYEPGEVEGLCLPG